MNIAKVLKLSLKVVENDLVFLLKLFLLTQLNVCKYDFITQRFCCLVHVKVVSHCHYPTEDTSSGKGSFLNFFLSYLSCGHDLFQLPYHFGWDLCWIYNGHALDDIAICKDSLANRCGPVIIKWSEISFLVADDLWSLIQYQAHRCHEHSNSFSWTNDAPQLVDFFLCYL